MVLDKISDLLAEKKDWQEMQNRAKNYLKIFIRLIVQFKNICSKWGQQIGIFLMILLNYLNWQ